MKLWTPSDIHVRQYLTGKYLSFAEIVPVGDIYLLDGTYHLRIPNEVAGKRRVFWERISEKKAHQMLDDAYLCESYGVSDEDLGSD